MWRDACTPDPIFTDTLELDLSTVEPSLAGPKRPQDRVLLSQAAPSFGTALTEMGGGDRRVAVAGTNYELKDGDVVIAAITSCTNTSNPAVLMAAGLLAKKAVAKGLTVKPWVKTSLAPGSQVVTDYLEKAGLQTELDKLGFNLVGYGCTTCIGNSGPLSDEIIAAVEAKDLVVAAVLSGNRNFEGRVSPQTKANYLASPPLVVAYALAGSMKVDLVKDPLGTSGGMAKHFPSGQVMPLYDAAMKYKADAVPLVVFGGKEYGTGSSRDWAAKGTVLLGIRAVIVESFERIHRSNLVGMGVLPLQFMEGMTRKTLNLVGDEIIDVEGIASGIKPRMDVNVRITRADKSVEAIKVLCRIDTADEIEYYRHGGILQYVLRGLMTAA